LTINADGTIAPITTSVKRAASRKSATEPAHEVMRVGSHMFIAQVLMLLEAFIGETLTLHLVTDVWPHVPLHDLDTDRGEIFEKAN
jgi:hypothetical protein